MGPEQKILYEKKWFIMINEDESLRKWKFMNKTSVFDYVCVKALVGSAIINTVLFSNQIFQFVVFFVYFFFCSAKNSSSNNNVKYDKTMPSTAAGQLQWSILRRRVNWRVEIYCTQLYIYRYLINVQ